MFANVLLIRYGTGNLERLVEREDTASTFAYGRYEAYLELGDVFSEAEAFRKADSALAVMAQEQRDITAAVLPVTDADRPYVTYGIGNEVVVPDEDGNPSSERVITISGAMDNDSGVVAITLGLRQQILSPGERIARVLHRGAEGRRDILSEIARRIMPPTA